MNHRPRPAPVLQLGQPINHATPKRQVPDGHNPPAIPDPVQLTQLPDPHETIGRSPQRRIHIIIQKPHWQQPSTNRRFGDNQCVPATTHQNKGLIRSVT